MYKKQTPTPSVFRFKHFVHKPYAAFNSLRLFEIGVLAVQMLAFANPGTLCAQTDTLSTNHQQQVRLDGVEVIGSRVPLTQAEAARIVIVLDRTDINAAPVQSVNDLLKHSPGVDVRQRGAMGIQTDISIRGGTFDQTTILLNGVNINCPQIGHYSADFPVSLDDIERIEILEGPAARVFGTSAFNGAINIVTTPQTQRSIRLNATAGSYGLVGGGANLNLPIGKCQNSLSGGYLRSDGATLNSDFNSWRAFLQGVYSTTPFTLQWQAGVNRQAYGANTFYSAKYNNQHDATTHYIVSLRADSKLGPLHLSPTIYWNRFVDHYQLVRNTDFGENFHRTDVYGLNINSYFTTIIGKTSLGVEMREEGILSTNLGRPLDPDRYVNVCGRPSKQYTRSDSRTNLSLYLEHNVLLPKATFSLGVVANKNTAFDHRFHLYPGIDISYRPSRQWKLFASWNMALRMPNFTDLYYKSPVIEGNVGLHPEETQAFNIGARYRIPILTATASTFYHKGKNMLDWVMYTPDDIYHSANFKLDNYGFDTNLDIYFREAFGEGCFLNNLRLGYAYIHQRRHDDTPVYKSNYALEYLRHKFTATLTHSIVSHLSATWAFRWQERMGSYIHYSSPDDTGTLTPYAPYALLDLRLQWDTGTYQLYAEANNLLNRSYYDFGNIPQPGFWFRAGGSIRFSF